VSQETCLRRRPHPAGISLRCVAPLGLGLMRLHGGIADLRPVTTALEAARLVDRDMERLGEGQAEVSGVRRILSFERRSPSPA